MDARHADNTLANAARDATVARRQLAAPLPGAIEDAIGDAIGTPEPAKRPAADTQPILGLRAPRRRTFRGQLLSRAALRQAVIMTEILGKPKALRQPE